MPGGDTALRGMPDIELLDIWHVSKKIDEQFRSVPEDNQEGNIYENYDPSIPLYLETDASGVGLGARLLLVKNGMSCGHDEMPDNAMQHPISSTNKCLSSTHWHYSNIEWEASKYYIS